MTTKLESSQPISALWPEQGSGCLASGKFIQRSVQGLRVAKQGEEEKMYEVHCFRPFTGFVYHILSSLRRTSEDSKKQKSISSAGNRSMGHGLNQWSREGGGPQGKEPGSPHCPWQQSAWMVED